MKDKTSTSNPFRHTINYNNISNGANAQTRVYIQNESGKDVRVINMNSRADGIVEIEFHEGEEMPFRYQRG